jgi:hypothetical protein
MPTKKQRRRRAKEHRHEYEVVWVDDEGNEVEVEPEAAAAKTKSAKPSSTSRGGRGRTVQAPSWPRSGRRALMFAPFFFAVLLLIQRSLLGALLVTAFYTAVFVPFTYALDSFAYRKQLKRQSGG